MHSSDFAMSNPKYAWTKPKIYMLHQLLKKYGIESAATITKAFNKKGVKVLASQVQSRFRYEREWYDTHVLKKKLKALPQGRPSDSADLLDDDEDALPPPSLETFRPEKSIGACLSNSLFILKSGESDDNNETETSHKLKAPVKPVIDMYFPFPYETMITTKHVLVYTPKSLLLTNKMNVHLSNTFFFSNSKIHPNNPSLIQIHSMYKPEKKEWREELVKSVGKGNEEIVNWKYPEGDRTYSCLISLCLKVLIGSVNIPIPKHAAANMTPESIKHDWVQGLVFKRESPNFSKVITTQLDPRALNDPLTLGMSPGASGTLGELVIATKKSKNQDGSALVTTSEGNK